MKILIKALFTYILLQPSYAFSENEGLREAKKIKELYPLALQANPITAINNSVTVE